MYCYTSQNTFKKKKKNNEKHMHPFKIQVKDFAYIFFFVLFCFDGYVAGRCVIFFLLYTILIIVYLLSTIHYKCRITWRTPGNNVHQRENNSSGVLGKTLLKITLTIQSTQKGSPDEHSTWAKEGFVIIIINTNL